MIGNRHYSVGGNICYLPADFPPKFAERQPNWSDLHCRNLLILVILPARPNFLVMSRQIDHFVYAVTNLEAACEALEKELGVAPVEGGVHPDQGTRNALLNLGEGAYLEVIAKMEDAQQPAGGTWMGMDLVTYPQLNRWCLKSDQLEVDQQIVQAYHPGHGQIIEGSRMTPDGERLSWRMLLPLPYPTVELMPFAVDWSTSSFHPTDRMPQHARFYGFELWHPAPQTMRAAIHGLGLNMKIHKGAAPKIRLTIEGPNGKVKL